MNRVIAAVGMLVLCFGSANAADMLARPVYGVTPVLTSVWTWTGCYVGAHVGGGWAHKSWRDLNLGGAEFASHGASGWLGGFQIGCDYQVGGWVVGVEGQAAWAGLFGDSPDLFSGSPPTTTVHSRVDALGALTARFGYAWGPILLFGKGGVALTHDSYWLTDPSVSLPDGILGSADEARWGWTIGAGLEWAFTPNWSLKFEYGYLDFGSLTLTFAFFDGTTELFDIDQQIHTAKVGINYRFSSW
jgi:outer membrane immunogenic protein